MSDDPTTASIERQSAARAQFCIENQHLRRELAAAHSDLAMTRADRDRLVDASGAPSDGAITLLARWLETWPEGTPVSWVTEALQQGAFERWMREMYEERARGAALLRIRELETSKKEKAQMEDRGAPIITDALGREIGRISSLDDAALHQEVAQMAANWLVEHGTDLDGDDGISGAERIAAAYRERLSSGSVGEAAYLALLRRILDHGVRRTDRTGTGTYSIFGAQLRFDLRQGFPLLTTKRVPFSSVIKELLWFLRGSTNIADLDCKIWDEWADERGELGPIYGHQWRDWGGSRAGQPRYSIGVDQISQVISQIKTSPDSRRLIVSAWNVADLPQMRLPPCHLLFQLYVDDGHLDLQLYQRSADMALGVPFNIASYALLLSMIAVECRLAPRYFVHTFGDAHVYANHVEGVRLQLTREPLPSPRLQLSDKPVLAQTLDDVRLIDYQHHPAIQFAVSV